MPASTGVDKLYDAIEGDRDKRGHKLYNATEANFLEVLRGCSNGEVNYFNSKNFSSNVLIELAYSHDWPKAAAAVIERGCDVNAKDTSFETALHKAGAHNHRETARVLLERGADRTMWNDKLETAAKVARRWGKNDIAAYIDGANARFRLALATLPPQP